MGGKFHMFVFPGKQKKKKNGKGGAGGRRHPVRTGTLACTRNNRPLRGARAGAAVTSLGAHAKSRLTWGRGLRVLAHLSEKRIRS